jgi:hypothetical protein
MIVATNAIIATVSGLAPEFVTAWTTWLEKGTIRSSLSRHETAWWRSVRLWIYRRVIRDRGLRWENADG